MTKSVILSIICDYAYRLSLLGGMKCEDLGTLYLTGPDIK